MQQHNSPHAAHPHAAQLAQAQAHAQVLAHAHVAAAAAAASSAASPPALAPPLRTSTSRRPLPCSRTLRGSLCSTPTPPFTCPCCRPRVSRRCAGPASGAAAVQCAAVLLRLIAAVVIAASAGLRWAVDVSGAILQPPRQPRPLSPPRFRLHSHAYPHRSQRMRTMPHRSHSPQREPYSGGTATDGGDSGDSSPVYGADFPQFPVPPLRDSQQAFHIPHAGGGHAHGGHSAAPLSSSSSSSSSLFAPSSSPAFRPPPRPISPPPPFSLSEASQRSPYLLSSSAASAPYSSRSPYVAHRFQSAVSSLSLPSQSPPPPFSFLPPSFFHAAVDEHPRAAPTTR